MLNIVILLSEANQLFDIVFGHDLIEIKVLSKNGKQFTDLGKLCRMMKDDFMFSQSN